MTLTPAARAASILATTSGMRPHHILRRIALGTALGIGRLVFDWPMQARSNTVPRPKATWRESARRRFLVR
jgi:hypothetical protein